MSPLSSLAESAQGYLDSFERGTPNYEALRSFAKTVRGEGLSVRLPGIPGGEWIARAADRYARRAVDLFGPGAALVRREHDRVDGVIRDAVGLEDAGPTQDRVPLPMPSVFDRPSDGFLVQIPGWEDVIQLPVAIDFDQRTKREKWLSYAEQIRRSPMPPSVREVGEILTTIDDLQDEAATLAVALAVIEKVAGRAIPGVGQLATAADALNFLQAFVAPAGGAAVPGRLAKRRAIEYGKQSSNGLRGRIEEMRRTGDLKLGWSDLIQGLQATVSWFGVGIQLGGVIGAAQDLFWAALRGGEVRAGLPLPDLLQMSNRVRQAYFRSPSLDLLHPHASYWASNAALSTWRRAARIAPIVDQFDESVLAWLLVGTRLSENVLGPWLRSGAWVEPVAAELDLNRVMPGGIASGEWRGLRSHEWIPRTAPAAAAAIIRAINQVPDRARQRLYESLVASIGWGLMADVEPGATVSGVVPSGFTRDAFLLLEAGRLPVLESKDE